MRKWEWATIAAWIDTEGSIQAGISGRKGDQRHLRISIGQRDPAPLRWIQSRVGGSIHRTKRGSFRLSISSRQAEAVLRGSLPYFLSKRAQAELGIELADRGPRGSLSKARQLEIAKELSRLKHQSYEDML